jgi:hypothetical protein
MIPLQKFSHEVYRSTPARFRFGEPSIVAQLSELVACPRHTSPIRKRPQKVSRFHSHAFGSENRATAFRDSKRRRLRLNVKQ